MRSNGWCIAVYLGVAAATLGGCAAKREPVARFKPTYSYLQADEISSTLTDTSGVAMADNGSGSMSVPGYKPLIENR